MLLSFMGVGVLILCMQTPLKRRVERQLNEGFPAAAELFGTEAEQEAIDETAELLSFGGGGSGGGGVDPI